MPAERRKPRPRPKSQTLVARPAAGVPPGGPAQASSSRRHAAPRHNLKLSEWLAVFAFIDDHPTLSQQQIVRHFATLASGPLVFTQSTLSRRLQERATLERRVHDNPSALDSKRPRVVTRPDVEQALFLWVKHAKRKGEHVNGSALKEKRRRFEELFNVPEEERLFGDGWLASFSRAYKIGEHPGRVGDVAPIAAVAAVDPPVIPQLAAVENEISELILELQRRNCISGTPLTVDEFIEPEEEREDPDSTADVFELGGDEAIVVEVVRGMAEQSPEMIDSDDDDDDDDEPHTPTPDISRGEAIDLCTKLTEACLQHVDAPNSDLAVGLLSHLRRFHAFLHQQELAHSRQTTLHDFFAPHGRQSSVPST